MVFLDSFRHLTKLAAIDATATEINLIDGGATVGTTAIADGDGLLINDAGTMRVSTVQTLAAYLDDEITAMPNLVTTAATTVGALDSGSITSGFTSIDVGAGAITTTGTGTIGNLVVDDVAVNGKVITMTGSTGDTFVTTVGTNGATSLVTVDTAAAAAHLQITADGTVDIDSAGVLTLDSGAAINIEPAAGSAILLDGTISVDAGVVTGATSVTSTAFVGNLTGTVATVTQNSITTMTGLTTTGALGAGSIAAGFGAIDNGTSNIRSATITAETAFVPDASGGADLGTTSLEFNNLYLNDLGEIYWGDDQDIILRQIADGQLEIKRNTTSDGTYPRLTLSTGDTDIGANALLGAIEFKAPNEGAGTDAIIASAQVSAAAEGDFSSSNNATSLQFRTAASGTATTKMSVKSDGKVGIGTTAPAALLGLGQDSGSGDSAASSGIAFETSNNADMFQISTVGGANNTARGLKFSADGNEKMRMSADGMFTTPFQPAFLAQPSGVQSNIAANASNVTVAFATERYDQNADFASNTFTAPVTGKYALNVGLYLTGVDTGATYYSVYITTSNRGYEWIQTGTVFGVDDPTYAFVMISCLADMDTSDTAFIKIVQNAGAAQTDINTASWFSGYLAC